MPLPGDKEKGLFSLKMLGPLSDSLNPNYGRKLDLRPKTVKLREENLLGFLYGLCNKFIDMTSKTHPTKV